MIKLKRTDFYESREELAKRIDELERDILSRFPDLTIYDDANTLQYNYSLLRTQHLILDFIRCYMLGTRRMPGNWVAALTVKAPIAHPHEFRKLVNDTMSMIMAKTPSYGQLWNSTYFMALHFLNKIEVEEEDGT